MAPLEFVENQIRSVAFGGFNRQDVLDYIEKSGEEQKEKEALLQKQAEELKAALAAAEQERDRLSQEAAALKAENETLRAEESAARQREAARQQELEELRQSNEELKLTVAQLKPQADMLNDVKSQMVDIEMDARVRSDGILKKANQSAQAVYAQAEEILAAVRQQYGKTQSELGTVTAHVLQELKAAQRAVEEMSITFSRSSAAVAGLKLKKDALPQPGKPGEGKK